VTAYIGLGANLGDREATLRDALLMLRDVGEVTSVSSLYETDPVGFTAQPAFLNAVAAIETGLNPDEVVRRLLDIERALGRERSFANAPRPIDLDLLLNGDTIARQLDATVPHPRMHQRAFVLAPLAEIAGAVVHPEFGTTIADLLMALPDQRGVRLYRGPGWAIPKKGSEGTSSDC
jgi:2-amino-4-hydroxy-6-hydroxymethyldihydropteridine diphosphokinase